MKAVLQLFWQICLLRGGPQRVPTYSWFMASVIVANILCSTILSALLDSQFSLLATLNSTVVALSTSAGLVWLGLYLRDLSDRFTATITAIIGCDLIITACFGVTAPLVSMISEGAASLIFLLFLVWSVTVVGFIMHKAMNVALGVGIGLALGISVLSVAMSRVAIGA